MTGGGYPDAFREILGHWSAGRRAETLAAYSRWLPLINHENRQCGLLAAKALMLEGGVIACDAPRAPCPPMTPASRAGLLEIARGLDPMVLRWGR
jgi:2-keto-3-deoxy-L-arabinonate dehydratase